MGIWRERLRIALMSMLLFASISFVFGPQGVFGQKQHASHATANPIRIMPLGDSITVGIHSSDDGGYRAFLWQRLQRAGIPVEFVGSQEAGPPSIGRNHEGHAGALIRTLIPHIVEWVKRYRPQIILLSIGSNDMGSPLDRPVAIEKLGYLLDLIAYTSPQTVVIVAQITPLCQFDADVQTYNQEIAQLIQPKALLGEHLLTVNMHNAVTLKDLTDCTHPNDAGYAHMAQVWYQGLMMALMLYGITSGQSIPMPQFQPL